MTRHGLRPETCARIDWAGSTLHGVYLRGCAARRAAARLARTARGRGESPALVRARVADFLPGRPA